MQKPVIHIEAPENTVTLICNLQFLHLSCMDFNPTKSNRTSVKYLSVNVYNIFVG